MFLLSWRVLVRKNTPFGQKRTISLAWAPWLGLGSLAWAPWLGLGPLALGGWCWAGALGEWCWASVHCAVVRLGLEADQRGDCDGQRLRQTPRPARFPRRRFLRGVVAAWLSVGLAITGNAATTKAATTKATTRSAKATTKAATKTTLRSDAKKSSTVGPLDAATVAAARGEAPSRTPATGSPYLIGLLGAWNSADPVVADAAKQSRHGAELAVSFLNDLGGIGGRPVALVVAEEGATEATAVAAFQTLVDRGAHLVLGPTLSRSMAALVPVAERNSVVLLGMTTAAVGVPKLSPWVRRTAVPRDRLAKGAMEELSLQRPLKNAVVLATDVEPTTIAVAAIYREFAAGLSLIAFDPNGKDPDAIAEAIATLGPDLVILVGRATSANSLLVSMSRVGVRANILIDGGALAAGFTGACLKICDNIFSPVQYDPEDVSTFARATLLRRYRDVFGGFPSLAVAQGFAAAQFAAIALDGAVAAKPSGSVGARRIAVRTVLGGLEIDTPIGILRMGSDGEVVPLRVAVGSVVNVGGTLRLRALPPVTTVPLAPAA